jgi:hypothetical protein
MTHARVIRYRGAFRVVYGFGGITYGWRTFDDVRDTLAFVLARQTRRVTFAGGCLP